MLIFAIILISVTGVLCQEEEDCWLRIHNGCDRNVMVKGFPDTTEELDTVCRNAIALAKCMLGFFKECGEEERADYKQKVVEFLEKSCDPKDPTYEAISSNLKCVKDAIEQTDELTCTPTNERRKEIMLSHDFTLHQLGSESKENSWCIDIALEVACPSMIVDEKCGEPARDAILNIYFNLNFIFTKFCTEELAVYMPTLLETLQVEDQGVILESLIRRRK